MPGQGQTIPHWIAATRRMSYGQRRCQCSVVRVLQSGPVAEDRRLSSSRRSLLFVGVHEQREEKQFEHCVVRSKEGRDSLIYLCLLSLVNEKDLFSTLYTLYHTSICSPSLLLRCRLSVAAKLDVFDT
jgi:hypothetical protein